MSLRSIGILHIITAKSENNPFRRRNRESTIYQGIYSFILYDRWAFSATHSYKWKKTGGLWQRGESGTGKTEQS